MAPSKMRFILQDYRKIGNKSPFSQAMDFFKVLHGGVYNEYGKFVQWTSLGEVNLRNLALIKNSTELAKPSFTANISICFFESFLSSITTIGKSNNCVFELYL